MILESQGAPAHLVQRKLTLAPATWRELGDVAVGDELLVRTTSASVTGRVIRGNGRARHELVVLLRSRLRVVEGDAIIIRRVRSA